MSRARNYCFTQNNYPDTTLVDSIECQYIIYGKEVGASGTPHLQGFITFKVHKSLKQVIGLLPGCHVEPAISAPRAILYCQKDGDYTERGTPPATQKEKGKKGADYWTNLRLAAEEGNFEEIPPEIRFKNKRLIEDHHLTALKKRALSDTESTMLWYYGPSGTGKSRKAREENPDAYLKMCNKWWDGYTDQDVVLIEDFDKAHSVLGHHLKIWADRYPFLAEVKGGAMKIRPKLIIVTSNYAPEEIWEDQPTLEPILRRFQPHHFTNPFP